MTKLSRSFTINNNVVEHEKNLGKGYAVYTEIESDYSMTKYIVKDDEVLFSIYTEAEGDDMAHISEFDINLME